MVTKARDSRAVTKDHNTSSTNEMFHHCPCRFQYDKSSAGHRNIDHAGERSTSGHRKFDVFHHLHLNKLMLIGLAFSSTIPCAKLLFLLQQFLYFFYSLGMEISLSIIEVKVFTQSLVVYERERMGMGHLILVWIYIKENWCKHVFNNKIFTYTFISYQLRYFPTHVILFFLY